MKFTTVSFSEIANDKNHNMSASYWVNKKEKEKKLLKQKRFKTYDDERELKLIEKILSNKTDAPFVHCSYDSTCSHKFNNEELKERRVEDLLKSNEFIINYELYKDENAYNASTGGYDGEVYELIYTTNKGDYITLKECYHGIFE